MTDPRMTTIIAWRDRPELGQTLRHNAPFLEAMRSDVIVVNCGGDSRSLRQILGSSGVKARQIDLSIERFNKSFALNVGLHEARPGPVFVLDADILLTASLESHAAVCARRRCFAIASAMTTVPVTEPPIFDPPSGSFLEKVVMGTTLTYYWADGTVTHLVQKRLDCGNNRTIAPGIMLVLKEHLVNAGGYRSDLVGWGWEDIDIQTRLLRRGLECVYMDEEIKHLDHGDDKRDLYGPKTEVARANKFRVWNAYCAGEPVGTYDSDIETWQSEPLHAAVG